VVLSSSFFNACFTELETWLATHAFSFFSVDFKFFESIVATGVRLTFIEKGIV